MRSRLTSKLSIGPCHLRRQGMPSYVTEDLTQTVTELTDAEIRERMSGNICRCAAYCFFSGRTAPVSLHGQGHLLAAPTRPRSVPAEEEPTALDWGFCLLSPATGRNQTSHARTNLDAFGWRLMRPSSTRSTEPQQRVVHELRPSNPSSPPLTPTRSTPYRDHSRCRGRARTPRTSVMRKLGGLAA
jgi:hypothetical protein